MALRKRHEGARSRTSIMCVRTRTCSSMTNPCWNCPPVESTRRNRLAAMSTVALMLLRNERCKASTAWVRIDHLADARRERKERHDVVPSPAPSRTNRGIAFAPFGLELLKPHQGHVGGLGPVDLYRDQNL